MTFTRFVTSSAAIALCIGSLSQLTAEDVSFTLAGGGTTTTGGETCTKASECAGKIITGAVRNCVNYKVIECTVKECGKPDQKFDHNVSSDWSGNADEFCKNMPSGGSWIDNTTFNYLYASTDWQFASAPGGCLPCGSVQGMGDADLPVIALRRIHRYRDVIDQSSLGPGVFLSHDITLQVAMVDDGTEIRYFNPNLQNPIWAYDGLYGDTADGVFHDGIKDYEHAHILDRLELTTGAGGQGDVAPSVWEAAGARVIALNGSVFRFDLFDIANAPTTLVEVDPVAGSAGIFDGQNLQVVVPDDAAINAMQVTQRTVQVRFRADDLSAGRQVIFEEGGDDRGLVILIDQGNLVVSGHNLPSDEGNWAATDIVCATPLVEGQWHTATLVLDTVLGGDPSQVTTNGLRGYLDGQPFGAVDATPIGSHTGDVRIGAAGERTRTATWLSSGSAVSAYFIGRIAQVDIYNRAVSEAELASGLIAADDLVTSYDFTNLNGHRLGNQVADGPDALYLNGAEFVGRLTAAEDRNGYGLTFTYPTLTAAEIAASPERQFLAATITDAYNRTFGLAWKDQQIGARWVLDQVEVTPGLTVDYNYDTNGFLSGAILPDGSQSTFAWRYDAETGTDVLSIDDAAAKDSHRRREVYLTNQYNEYVHGNYHRIINSSSMLVRLVANGNDEISYFNAFDDSEWSRWYVYENGKLRQQGSDRSIYFKEGWTYDPTVKGLEAYTVEPEDVHMQVEYGSWRNYSRQTPRAQTDEQGVRRTFVYNADNLPTKITWADGTTETYSYNAFRQVTRRKDRANQVGLRSYDERGNLLTVETGLLWNGSSDVPQAEHAIVRYEYFPAGHQHQFLKSAMIDANGNRTTYAYDDNHHLITVTEPADLPGGTAPVKQVERDGLGRVLVSHDQAGRSVHYDYDARERVFRRTYGDGSTEELIYGSGSRSHVLTREIDRNGNITDYSYDDAGRRTQVQTGHLRMVGGVETPVADPATAVTETCSYRPGTTLRAACVKAGELVQYDYDYRNRLVATTRYSQVGTALTNQTVYVENRVFARIDAYGRASYRVYRSEDGALVREVHGLMPSFRVADAAAAMALARDLEPNPDYTIIDYTVDAVGRRTAVVDARGVQRSMTYDSRGRLVAIVEAVGSPVERRTEYDYDAHGNRIAVRHPRHFVATETGPFQTLYGYTGRNLLESETVAAGTSDEATRFMTYSPTGKLATQCDFRGNVTEFLYGTCCDRLITVIDPSGAQTSYDYDHQGNRTVVTDANGNATITTYDARHRVQTITNAEGETVTYVYDDNLTDGVGLDASYPAAIADLGFQSGAVDGSAVAITNAAGETSLRIMDGLGRALRSVDAVGNATTMGYDTVVDGLVVTSTTDALGHVGQRYADGAGRVRLAVDALGAQILAAFDANGNRLSFRDANGIGSDATYDDLNRPDSQTDTSGDVVATGYNAHDAVTSTIDAMGNLATNAYDARDRRVVQTDRLGNSTRFAYDDDSNLLRIEDAEGGVTDYGYDERSLLVEETFPNGEQGRTRRVYGYDDARRLASRTVTLAATTPSFSEVTTYEYDDANRLTARVYPAAAQQDGFAYDAAGRLLTATSDRYANTVLRSYDAAGRLETERLQIDGADYLVGYGYDADHRLTSLTYPSGATVGRSYTARHQLETVTFNGSAVATMGYDAAGRLSQRNYGNGLMEQRTYISQENLVGSITVPGVVAFAYTYDANDRKTAEYDNLDPAHHQFFGYDDADRLTSWQRDGLEDQSWTLSAVGDWITTQRTGVNPVNQTRDYSPVHELSSITDNLNGGQVSALGYDAKGNLVENGAGQTYAWDQENRLATAVITGGDANQAIYRYDALGRRVQKVVDGVATTFVSAGAQVVEEFDGAGVSQRGYVYGSYVDEPLAMIDGPVDESNVYYFHSNHLYSVAAVTNAAGEVCERYHYSAYGERSTEVVAEDLIGQDIGFTGRRLDDETGLWYFRARYYDAGQGRFIGRDPAGYLGGGLSLYRAYFAPNRLDPLGLYPEDDCCENDADPVSDDAGAECCPEDIKTVELRADVPDELVRNQIGDALGQIIGGANAEDVVPDTGHTFLSGPGFTVGFYPGDSWFGSSLDEDDDGHFVDDEYHGYTHFIEYRVCPSTLKRIRDRIQRDRENPPTYNLLQMQCTSWACSVLQGAGIDTGVPSPPAGFPVEPGDVENAPGSTSLDDAQDEAYFFENGYDELEFMDLFYQ